MKILHVFDHSIPLHSGYTFRSRAILREQQNLGFETCHVTSAKQGTTEQLIEIVDDLKFYRSEVPKSFLFKAPVIDQMAIVSSLKKRLREVIEIEQPDILHAHSPALNGLAAVQVGKELGLPVVYEIRAFWEDAAVDHGTCKEGDLRYKLTRSLENHVVKNANHVTTICNGLKDDLVSRGVNADKVTQIPNAVELSKFKGQKPVSSSVEKLKKELGLSNSYVLGFLGSFYAYEGLDLVIDAIPKILENKPDTKLLLVGGGPQEANLKEQVRDLKLDEQVIFTGRVPHAQVADYYATIDLLVFPRKSMRLTELVTPLKPLEAMAQSKLVLASNVGGHKELIKDGVTGYLFDANNCESLVDKIDEIVNRDSSEVLENGLAYVVNQRNWTNSVKSYTHVYAEARKHNS